MRALLNPRQLATILTSRGPWRVAPFREILARRHVGDGEIHQAEDFSGYSEAARDEIVSYTRPIALLDQKIESPAVGNRPRYITEGAWFAPKLQLFSLADAGVATADGVVYCPQSRTAVQETARRWDGPASRNPLLRAPRFPKATALRGVSLSLLTLSGAGFYHFLLEALPRWGAVKRQFTSFDHVLVPDTAAHFTSPWLTAAGIPPSKVIRCGPLAHYRCEQLVFGGPSMADCRPTRQVVETLRGIFGISNNRRSRCLWISRSDASERHLQWEDDLLNRLPTFEKVVLTRLQPTAQIELFASAAAVAGPHGAGLAHLAFAPPGVRLVEFSPTPEWLPNFCRLAQVVGGTAAWAHVDFSEPDVELDDLAARIRGFGAVPV
jgi:capsular polysaccharide biosynthesis protein